MKTAAFIATWLLLIPLIGSEELEIEDFVTRGISIDLNDPTYLDGCLTTSGGGVISAPELRIQARNITYQRQRKSGIETIDASDQLMVQCGDYLFIGKHLHYDVTNNSGFIKCGRSVIEPWYFGGETISLCSDKSFLIDNGFITTSEGETHDWALLSDSIFLSNEREIQARNVTFKVWQLPLFWMPKFSMRLASFSDSPFHYQLRWGGEQGPRLRVIYDLLSWEHFRTALRFEYRLKRGPGIGVETDYCSPNQHEAHETISYIARDSAICQPHERIRYRLQGKYRNCFNDNKTSLHLCYDKLSDKEMAEDYCDETLNIAEAGRTEFHLRHQECSWISNFVTRLQINNFQTVKEEIPTLQLTAHPYTIFNSGIIGENSFTASYLNYEHASNLRNVHDYQSTRVELRTAYYCPFHYGCTTITPRISGIGIYYGNSPEKEPQMVTNGLFNIDAITRFYRQYNHYRHLIEPYASYHYVTFPNKLPDEHFTFDIEDGWYQLNHMRIGIRNQLFIRGKSIDNIERCLNFDLFSDSFFNTATIPRSFYKVIGRLAWQPNSRLRHTTSAGWNCFAGQLDFVNYRMEYTLSENFAISAEYRHRGRYQWRKVDHDNFIVDSFHTIPALLTSKMSDKRDTLLLHTFCRFHPFWAVEYQVRHGWNRSRDSKHPEIKTAYTEMQADLHTNLGSTWNLTLSYQLKEDDHRIALYFNLGPKRPNRKSALSCIAF